ncbi:MAG: hypothetical protein IJU52_00550 [Clostridia bacterium]|nr:hypothetical protein [Clostridia bacterium]
MRNKILSFVLCLAMCAALLSVFAGCSSGNVPQVVSSDAMAQTMVLAMIRDDRTTDAAVKSVEEALNKITETEFNTHIILKMFTADEYADKILTMSKNLYDRQEAYEAKYTSESGFSDTDNVNADTRQYALDDNVEYIAVANGDLMYYDENGRLATMYPTVPDDQLDVIFINDLSLYYQLVQNSYVIPLSNTLSTESAWAKKMSMIINSSLYKMAELTGDGVDCNNRGDFAIPNNYVTSGERYLVVNKKLYDHYKYSVECDIFNSSGAPSAVCDDLADFIEFLEDAAKGNAELKNEGSDLYVDKILYNFSDIGWINCFDGSDHTNSAVMQHAGVDLSQLIMNDLGNTLYPTSIYEQPYFRKVAGLISDLRNEYGCAPYIGECFYRGTEEEIGFPAPAAAMADNKETFALAMVTGDASTASYYDPEDYYVVKIGSPVIDNRMYESMFAVSTFSTTALDAEGMNLRTHITDYFDQENPRALEIIYAMQTNAEIVNLLTYGVLGYNYDIYENENNNLVHNAGKNDYYPILGKAGNVFLSYQNDQMSSEELYYSANNWKAAKNQKNIVSRFCGIPSVDEVEDGADYSAAEITEFFKDFYADKIDGILNFAGKDESGAPCTIDEYLDAVNKELTSSGEYKCYKDCTFDKGYRITPSALITTYYFEFYQDTNVDDIDSKIADLSEMP